MNANLRSEYGDFEQEEDEVCRKEHVIRERDLLMRIWGRPQRLQQDAEVVVNRQCLERTWA